ncbi:hypothetical protein TVAG_152390 [Trichomonas vaginalis G3]|uniref:Uncharacterized protein n=1 Tax=Trichomonas vaginalis (strain ATCC PRA-98 / G3) TaxID=412133 RepID=A2F715_TRIV3|nr:hypothetical protein TVAG_152390 [Trichomonas vaginalis G3]|eukprot:XP_001312250.1 hypothetical protein [Trichomonas vaginalis G3]
MYKDDDETDRTKLKMSEFAIKASEEEDLVDQDRVIEESLNRLEKEDENAINFLNQYLFLPSNISIINTDGDTKLNILNELLHPESSDPQADIKFIHAIKMLSAISASTKISFILQNLIVDENLELIVSILSHPNKEIALNAALIIYNMMIDNSSLLIECEKYNFWNHLFSLVSVDGNESETNLIENLYTYLSYYHSILWRQKNSDESIFRNNYYNYAIKLLEFNSPRCIRRSFQCLSNLVLANYEISPNKILIDELMRQSTIPSEALNAIFEFLDTLRKKENEEIIEIIENQGFINNLINLLDYNIGLVNIYILQYLGCCSIYPDHDETFWIKLVEILQFGTFKTRSNALHYLMQMFLEKEDSFLVNFITPEIVNSLSDIIETQQNEDSIAFAYRIIQKILNLASAFQIDFNSIPCLDTIYESACEASDSDYSYSFIAKSVESILEPLFSSE